MFDFCPGHLCSRTEPWPDFVQAIFGRVCVCESNIPFFFMERSISDQRRVHQRVNLIIDFYKLCSRKSQSFICFMTLPLKWAKMNNIASSIRMNRWTDEDGWVQHRCWTVDRTDRNRMEIRNISFFPGLEDKTKKMKYLNLYNIVSAFINI